MTIYVDELRNYQELMGHGLPGLWCHMVTDNELDELHDFAMQLGINPRRFQNHPRHPHYDLMPDSRSLALAFGAVEISTSEMRKILARRLNGQSPPATGGNP